MYKLLHLTQALMQKQVTVGVVESCSGGYLSYLLTKVPGSSRVFKGGLIAYSLDAKHKFFKIPLARLKRTQGVSRSIAIELAVKARALFSVDIGLAIVGFAGPTALRTGQCGTVYIAYAHAKKASAKKLTLTGSRDFVRKRACICLIDVLLKAVPEIRQ